jgi:hypothetical protein
VRERSTAAWVRSVAAEPGAINDRSSNDACRSASRSGRSRLGGVESALPHSTHG